MKQDKITVVAAIIKNSNNQYLITQRPADSHEGGLWEFPGGTVEHGESHKEALAREILEELGISVYVEKLFWQGEFSASSKLIDIFFYECKMTNKENQIRLIEISDFRWVYPAEFKNFDFPEADIALIETLPVS